MGPHNTKQAQQQSSISLNHEQFKNAKITRQGSNTLMSFTIAAQEKQYLKWKLTLQKSSESKILTSQYLLFPVAHSFNKQGFCSSSGFANITYEYFPFLLVQQVQKRQSDKSRFQQSQLWFLLYALSSGQVEMKKLFNSKIGDVRPQNIFLNQDGEIRVSCLYSWPGQITNYSKSLQLKSTYLAPQQVQKLQSGQVDNLASYQSQIFSIGMTILSTILLKDCFYLYDLTKPKFNYGKYNQLVQDWRQNNMYSQIFKAIILNLISIEPEKRLTLQELYTFLNTYQRSIIKKNKFVIKNAPTKIQTTIKQLRIPQITYQSKFVSEVGSLSHQSTLSKKTSFQQPLSHYTMLSDAKGVQRSKSPVFMKVSNSSPASQFNFDVNTKMIPQNQIKFNYSSIDQKNINISQPDNKNIISQTIKTQNNKIQPQKDITKIQNSNSDQIQSIKNSQQVQTFFSPPQSMVSEQNNFPSNNQDYIYTRRVINVDTKSLLQQQQIDENQYIQGIRRKVSDLSDD